MIELDIDFMISKIKIKLFFGCGHHNMIVITFNLKMIFRGKKYKKNYAFVYITLTRYSSWHIQITILNEIITNKALRFWINQILSPCLILTL